MSNLEIDEGHGPAASVYPFARDRLFLTCGLAGVLLFWAALDDHSDGFYTFLRVYVCGLSVIWAIVFHSIDRPAWALSALCSSILFNPVFTVDFDRETWQVIDFVAGALYSWLALQTYAAFVGKPWLPYVPAGLVLGGSLLATVDFDRPYGSGYDQTMNVDEMMTTNEVLANDPGAFDDLIPALPMVTDEEVADAALEAAANAVEDASAAVEAAEGEKRVDYSGDWRKNRPDGTKAPPTASPVAKKPDPSELDRIFSRPLPTPDDPPEPQSNSVWANELNSSN